MLTTHFITEELCLVSNVQLLNVYSDMSELYPHMYLSNLLVKHESAFLYVVLE